MSLARSKDAESMADKHKGLARLTSLVRELARAGETLSYLSNVKSKDVASSAAVKDAFSARLKQSREAPQIITVQGRGKDADSEYVILPIEEVNRLIEAQINARETRFVPITQKLKAVGDAVPLPAVKPRRSFGVFSLRRRSVPHPRQTPVAG